MEDEIEEFKKKYLQLRQARLSNQYVHDCVVGGGPFDYYAYHDEMLRNAINPPDCPMVKRADRMLLKVFPDLQSIEDNLESMTRGLEMEIDIEDALRDRTGLKISRVELSNIVELYQRRESTECSLSPSETEYIDGLLREMVFFKKLQKEERHATLHHARLREFRPGEYVFRQGDVGKNMFIILAGSVSVQLRSHTQSLNNTAEYVWSLTSEHRQDEGRQFLRGIGSPAADPEPPKDNQGRSAGPPGHAQQEGHRPGARIHEG